MTKAIHLFMLGAVSWVGFVACGASVDEDAGGVESAAEALTPGNSTYYALRPDLRRCAAPACGGYFVKAVNQTSTRCVDGSAQSECYVAALDLSAIGLSAEQQQKLRASTREFVLRGALKAEDNVANGKLAVFHATEAWRGHGGVVPSGTFFRANETGLVCITFPCPHISAAVLNRTTLPLRISELDLSGISADPSDAHAQLNEPEGLLVAAVRTVVTGPAGQGIGLDASEYYVPFEGKRQSCGSRGLPQCDEGSYCNFPPSANCGRADAPGVCTDRPEVCTKEYNPVCGCDGQTYANACMAAAAGVSVEFKGACEPEERVCGTILGLACERGEFCDFGVGQCNVSDAGGVCRQVPQTCTEIFAPVCGCDGKTYENACSANRAGAQIDHEGACR